MLVFITVLGRYVKTAFTRTTLVRVSQLLFIINSGVQKPATLVRYTESSPY